MRRLKCEKFTDDGRQVMATVHISFGELKMHNSGLIHHSQSDLGLCEFSGTEHNQRHSKQ